MDALMQLHEIKVAFFTSLFQFYGRCDSDKAPKLGHLRGLTGNAKYNTYYCFSLLLPKNHKMINLVLSDSEGEI